MNNPAGRRCGAWQMQYNLCLLRYKESIEINDVCFVAVAQVSCLLRLRLYVIKLALGQCALFCACRVVSFSRISCIGHAGTGAGRHALPLRRGDQEAWGPPTRFWLFVVWRTKGKVWLSNLAYRRSRNNWMKRAMWFSSSWCPKKPVKRWSVNCGKGPKCGGSRWRITLPGGYVSRRPLPSPTVGWRIWQDVASAGLYDIWHTPTYYQLRTNEKLYSVFAQLLREHDLTVSIDRCAKTTHRIRRSILKYYG